MSVRADDGLRDVIEILAAELGQQEGVSCCRRVAGCVLQRQGGVTRKSGNAVVVKRHPGLPVVELRKTRRYAPCEQRIRLVERQMSPVDTADRGDDPLLERTEDRVEA